MKMQEVVVISEKFGIVAGNMTKTELIRAIQRAEGYTDCFSTNVVGCIQTTCLWREDCLE